MSGAEGRGGFRAGATPDELHVVSDGNLASLDEEAIERELAFEATVDVSLRSEEGGRGECPI
jgi:hypothetical protein